MNDVFACPFPPVRVMETLSSFVVHPSIALNYDTSARNG